MLFGPVLLGKRDVGEVGLDEGMVAKLDEDVVGFDVCLVSEILHVSRVIGKRMPEKKHTRVDDVVFVGKVEGE